MTINKRNKGHFGEREFVRLMNNSLPDLKNAAKRNIDQVRNGGADIISVKPFAVEVKRQQQLNINSWWKQAIRQTTKKNPIPVLVFRQNNMKWRVIIPCDVVIKKRFRLENERIEISLDLLWHIVRTAVYLP